MLSTKFGKREFCNISPSVNYSGTMEPNLSLFSDQEKQIISSVLSEHGKKSTDALVKLAHDLVWATFSEGEVIPMEAYLTRVPNGYEVSSQIRQIINEAELAYDE